MPTLRCIQGDNYTIDVMGDCTVWIQFWGKDDKPLSIDQIEFSRDDWLKIIGSTVDLMSKELWKKEVDDFPDKNRKKKE